MGTLRAELKKRGANSSQLSSAVTKMAEEAIAAGAIDEMGTAQDSANRLINTIEREQRKLEDWRHDNQASMENARMLRGVVNTANDTLRELRSAVMNARTVAASSALSDNTLQQSVYMYDEILQRTKSIVGDDMTEDIWLKTIEAASYGMWRAIMGPKFEEKSPRRI